MEVDDLGRVAAGSSRRAAPGRGGSTLPAGRSECPRGCRQSPDWSGGGLRPRGGARAATRETHYHHPTSCARRRLERWEAVRRSGASPGLEESSHALPDSQQETGGSAPVEGRGGTEPGRVGACLELAA